MSQQVTVIHENFCIYFSKKISTYTKLSQQ